MSDYLYVNVYGLSREYGGPEEGGWYFDAGFPVESHRVVLTDDDKGSIMELLTELGFDYPDFSEEDWMCYHKAQRWYLYDKAYQLQEELAQKYPTDGNYTSVIPEPCYSIPIEDSFAKLWPEERPRYE